MAKVIVLGLMVAVYGLWAYWLGYRRGKSERKPSVVPGHWHDAWNNEPGGYR